MTSPVGRPSSSYGYVYFITSVAALAGLLFGFDTGVISGALEPISRHFAVTGDFVKECIVAAVTLGALFGAASSSRFSSAQGRRRSILISALLFMAGTLLAAAAPAVAMLIAGRLIMGFAVGLSAMVVPMYLSEVSPPAVRGGVVFTFQLAITIGILAAYVINFLFSEAANWRMMFGVGLAPSLLLFVGMLRLPESPRWLVLHGRKDEAKMVLARIMTREDAASAMKNIAASVSRPRGGLRELFSARLFPLVAIAFTLFVLQQLSGINTIFYYAPRVLEQSGFQDPVLVAMIPATVNVLATVLGVWIVDRLGRRALAFLGFGGMAACLALLGADLNGLIGSEDMAPMLALACVLAYIFFFAVGLGGVPYIIMSELFPLSVRDVGMAVASCANWGFNFLVSLTFLSLSSALGMGGAFWLYACFMVLGLFFTFFFVPETRGARLEDIEANLYAGKRPRDLGAPAGS